MTTQPDPRDPRTLIALVAEQLGEACGQFVFLGGATCPILVTDAATLAPRPTKDVDLLLRLGTRNPNSGIDPRRGPR